MNIASTKQNNYFEYKPVYVSQLPIKKSKTGEIEKIVIKAINMKNLNPSTDTTQQEQEIDQLVYVLYGLIKEEISPKNSFKRYVFRKKSLY